MYIVQATVNGRQIPTFYLDENVQGIVDCFHAMRIAKDILNIMEDPNLELSIFVCKR